MSTRGRAAILGRMAIDSIGFIGLGRMGGHMAARLLAAGQPVYGTSRHRDRVQTLIDAGLRWCDSPAAGVDDVLRTAGRLGFDHSDIAGLFQVLQQLSHSTVATT